MPNKGGGGKYAGWGMGGESGFFLKSMNRDANYFRGMECAISGLDL